MHLQLEGTVHHDGEARQQELEAAGHTTSTARGQSVNAAVIQFLLYPVCGMMLQQPMFSVGFPTVGGLFFPTH